MGEPTRLDKCVTAALALASTRPWGTLTLAEISAEAGTTLADLHGEADKTAISAHVERYFDAAMSEGSFDEDETPRTRLFDVIMMRFEAMEDQRDGVMSFLRWRDRSVDGLALRVKARAQTVRWALTCAGLDGVVRLPRGLQLAGLAWTLAQAERAWRQETSPDMTRTMAALDAELLKAESRLDWLARLRTGSRPDDEATGDDPDIA